jgi:hypothetical protein
MTLQHKLILQTVRDQPAIVGLGTGRVAPAGRVTEPLGPLLCLMHLLQQLKRHDVNPAQTSSSGTPWTNKTQ